MRRKEFNLNFGIIPDDNLITGRLFYLTEATMEQLKQKTNYFHAESIFIFKISQSIMNLILRQRLRIHILNLNGVFICFIPFTFFNFPLINQEFPGAEI